MPLAGANVVSTALRNHLERPAAGRVCKNGALLTVIRTAGSTAIFKHPAACGPWHAGRIVPFDNYDRYRRS